jgi:5'-3' exonuclease
MFYASGDPHQANENYFLRLGQLQEHYKPDTCIAVFDSGTNFRKQILPTYKAGRKQDEGPKEAIRLARKTLHHDWVRLIAPDGYEADDMLASLAAQADGECVLIHSIDKDLYQCLSDTVGIIRKSGQAEVEQHGLTVSHKFVVEGFSHRDFVEKFDFPRSLTSLLHVGWTISAWWETQSTT